MKEAGSLLVEILEKLKSGKEIDTSNLNELMNTIEQNNNQSNIDLGQLQGLLKSKSFMGKRTTRFAMVVDDTIIQNTFVEEPGEYKVSSAEHLLTVV